jgi:hypothetical protein
MPLEHLVHTASVEGATMGTFGALWVVHSLTHSSVA